MCIGADKFSDKMLEVNQLPIHFLFYFLSYICIYIYKYAYSDMISYKKGWKEFIKVYGQRTMTIVDGHANLIR